VQELCCTTLFGPERGESLRARTTYPRPTPAEYLKLLRCSTFNVCRFQYPKNFVCRVRASTRGAGRAVLLSVSSRARESLTISVSNPIWCGKPAFASLLVKRALTTHRQIAFTHVGRHTHTHSSNRGTVWFKPSTEVRSSSITQAVRASRVLSHWFEASL
jgi:hypothetical protein